MRASLILFVVVLMAFICRQKQDKLVVFLFSQLLSYESRLELDMQKVFIKNQIKNVLVLISVNFYS